MSRPAAVPESAPLSSGAAQQPVRRHQVAHHFGSAEQEFSAAKFGFWIFLCTEILMFGGLFVAYTYYRHLMPETFSAAHHTLSVPLGTINTAVLIVSSFTMVLAIRAAMLNKQKQMMALLGITLFAAAVFMCIKLGLEWPHKIHEGTLPANWYTFKELTDVTNPHIFYALYFVMTGLHGLHVLIGMGLIVWLMIRGRRGDFYSGYFTPLEITGLYWHFVDLVWIFLFPLFYLVG